MRLLRFSRNDVLIIILIKIVSYAPNNLATPKAALAAAAPINITFNAPVNNGCPVALLLKNPKTNKQTNVIIAEIFNPEKVL